MSKNNQKKSWIASIIVFLSFALIVFAFGLTKDLNVAVAVEDIQSQSVEEIGKLNQESGVPEPSFARQTIPSDGITPTVEKTEQEKPSPINTETAHSGRTEDEETAKLVQTLNLATFSIKKIVETGDRVVLDQEYNNIINNLKLEEIKYEKSISNLFRQIMDAITQSKLSNEEKERFKRIFEEKKKKASWKAIGGIRAYGAGPLSFLLSLAQNSISAYFNYRDIQSEIQEELEESVWKLEKDRLEEINKLWKEWLDASWAISDKYNFKSKNYYLIRENSINEYLQADWELDIGKAMRTYERLSENEEFLSSYPPFWLSYAMKAERAGDASKRDECLNRFFENYREILSRDPMYGRACIMRVRSILERESNVPKVSDEVLELLKKADKHLDETDGGNRIFIAGLYQRLEKQEEAKKILQYNIDRGTEVDLSRSCLRDIERGEDMVKRIPALLALLSGNSDEDNFSIRELLSFALSGGELGRKELENRIEKMKGNIGVDLKELEVEAEKGNDSAMYILGFIYYNKGESSKAEQWYKKSAEKGNDSAMLGLGVLYYEQGDKSQAEQWWKKLAEKGNEVAMLLSGLFLSAGLVDKSQAKKYYEEAIKKGNVDAMINLGDLYAEGKGVAKDYVLAYAWYTVAIEKGDDSQKERAKQTRVVGILSDTFYRALLGNDFQEERAKQAGVVGILYDIFYRALSGNTSQKERARKARDNLFGWFSGITPEEVREAEELAKTYTPGKLLERKR